MRSEFRKQYGSKLLALFVVIIMITVVYPVLITNAKNPSQLSAYDNDWNDISDFSNDLNKDGAGKHEIKTIVSRPAIINKISEIEKNSTDPTIKNNDTILVIIGVERMYTEFDSGAIHEFVKNGGKVVLADDSGYGNSAFYGEMGSLEIGMKLRTNIVQEGCAPQKSDSLTGNVIDALGYDGSGSSSPKCKPARLYDVNHWEESIHPKNNSIVIADADISRSNEIGEWDKPTIGSRLSIASQGLSTFYGPTGMNKYNLEVAKKLVDEYKNDVELINNVVKDLEEKIKNLDHPHISGSGIN